MENFQIYFEDAKLYNMSDVLIEFSKYLGMDYFEMKDYFQKYMVISKKDIEKYIDENLWQIADAKWGMSREEILQRREKDYDILCCRLAGLADKGLRYLDLFHYLGSLKKDFEREEKYELILEEMEIFHYSSILSGESLNRFMIAMMHLLMQFQKTINQVNCLENYQTASFCEGVDILEYCPVSSLVLDVETSRLDKTSILVSSLSKRRVKDYFFQKIS